MIYLLYGEEEFLSRQELAALRAPFGSGDLIELNTTWLDGESLRLRDLEAAACSLPFMAECRIVVVEGLLGRLQRRRRRVAATGDPEDEPGAPPGDEDAGAEDPEWERLGAVLAAVPPTTLLVFLEGAVDPHRPAAKAVMAAAETRRFDRLRGARLVAWVRDRARQHGCALAGRALDTLVALAGNDLRLLDAELQKLALYAGGEPVDEETVRRLVPLTAETGVFGLVDAFVERQLTRAQRELHRLLAQGAAPPYLLFMLARQVRLVLMAADLLQQRTPQADLGQLLGLRDYALQKTLEQAQRADATALPAMLARLLEADLQVKQGPMDPVAALELLVTELCAPARQPATLRQAEHTARR